ncbi:MAG: M28 family metallopeptidase, partial [Exilispira sp.]
ISISNNFANQMVFAMVENIYVEIPGKNSSKILIVTHYDSVPYSFGAADNSAAVSASLANFEKICKEIQNGKKPLNSIMFLFTDAEELGLLGAEYFVKNYEEIDKIELVLNLDARGNRGRTILFQSNDKSGKILKQYSKYDKSLIGFSFANDIYQKMPNSTDFTPFLKKDLKGLNFAFLQNPVVYHNSMDNIQNLSLNSLLENNLKIANFINAFSEYNFSEMNISNLQKGKEENKNKINNKNPFIYFTLFGRLIVFTKFSYFLFLIILFFGIVFLLIFSFNKKLFSFRNLFISLIQNLSLFIFFGILLFLVRYICYLIFPVLNIFNILPYNEILYFLFIYSIAFFLYHIVICLFNKYIEFYSFYISSSIFSFVLSLIVLKFVTGISLIFLSQSYVFIIIFIISILFKFYFNKYEEKSYYLFHFIPSIFTLPIGILFAYLSYISLGLKNIIFSFIGLYPIIPIFAGNYRRLNKFNLAIISTFLIILALVLFLAIINNYNFNSDKPLLSSMRIEKNYDTSELSIILPLNEVKYSNNLWHKSILSLGKYSFEKNLCVINGIKDVKFIDFNSFKILKENQTKKFKEYEIEISSNFWVFTLPKNSQIIIKDILNINFNEVSTFKGYTPFNQKLIVKLRIPQSEILKFAFINYYFEQKYDVNIPKRPKEIIGIYDYILEKGTLK